MIGVRFKLKEILCLSSLLFVVGTVNAKTQAVNPDFSFSGTCVGENIIFSDMSTSTSAIVQYIWDFDIANGQNTDTSHAQNPTYVYDEPGMYNVQIYIENIDGDFDSIIKVVNIFPKPNVGFSEVVPCFPDPVEFIDTSTISSGTLVNRIWEIDNNSYAPPTVSYSFGAKGSHEVLLLVGSDMGCLDSLRKTIIVGDKPTLSLSPSGNVTICDGDSLRVTASSSVNNYLWSTGDTLDNITIKTAGNYKVISATSNDCITIDSVEVIVDPGPTANAGVDTTVTFGDTVRLMGSGGQVYSWEPSTYLDNPDVSNPKVKPTESITYVLKVTNNNGCVDFDTIIVTVDRNIGARVTNLFTPNNDGVNDTWDISDVPGIDDARVIVLNRWGWEVLNTTEYEHDWNGEYEGKPLPEGTYVYMIIFKNQDNLKGTLEIIR